MRIFEAPGRLVRDPATMRRLPAEGLEVADGDVHWARMIADGDVGTAPPSARKPSTSPPKSKGPDQ
jgi:hypothetical protein